MCIEWNKERGYTIPNSVILNINKKFDKFQKYKWDHPDYIVDMSKELDLDKVISDIVLKMIKLDKEPNLQILRKELNNNEKKKKYTQKLDLITRDITGYLLKDQKNCLIKNKIIEKRKEFIKLNLREIMSELEIKTEFIKYLEMSLKIKVL